MRVLVSVLVLSVLSVVPRGAYAQTLTIEVEASVSAEPAPVLIVPRGSVDEADPLPVVPRPVVIVPPLEADERDPRWTDPRWTDPRRTDPRPIDPRVSALPPAPTVSAAAPDPEPHDDDEVQGYVAFGLWLESMDLSGLDLSMRSPEIVALAGTHLSRDWVGNAPLRRATVGGASIALGMRAGRYFRGPELRVLFGGSDAEGPWAAAPSGPDGLTLSVRSAFMVRVEAAMGLQLPLGPVTPYVLGRAAAGAAWVDVAVEDARLGALGTETVEAEVLELGIEAGIEVHPSDDGFIMGFAFRGSFLGTPSLGGMITVGFAGE